MRGWNATGQAELRRSGSIWGLFNSRLPLRWGEREPAGAGPALNPRHVGVATHHRQPGLMLAGTAAGQAELGRSGIIWCLFGSRCPLRWRERGHACRGSPGYCGLDGCWAGRVRAFRQYLCPFKLKIAPKAGRKGVCAHRTCVESKAGGRCNSSEAARANTGREGRWAVQVSVMRQDQCPF